MRRIDSDGSPRKASNALRTAAACSGTTLPSFVQPNDGQAEAGIPSARRRSFDLSWRSDFRRVSNRAMRARNRSEEHTSELQSRGHLVCRLLLEKKKDTVTGRL